jgi:putative endonuclease
MVGSVKEKKDEKPSLWRKIFGRKNERLAEKFIRRKGMKILARNWRCKTGEIDLIALDGKTIVFVEVKSRRSEDNLPPEAGITSAKRKHLIRAAKWFINMKKAWDLVYRFDVIAVIDEGKSRPVIRHTPYAFTE